MKTIPLGNTGVKVSALCLGAMYFGTRQDEATSFRLLDAYADAGGSFIDSANIYAHWVAGFRGGESEALLARWMQARNNRSQVFLATKVGFDYAGVPRGLTPALIQAECEKSLKRLGVDTIDLYYAHVDDPITPLEVALGAFDRLVQQGKVRYIGASNYTAWRLEEARWTSQVNNLVSFCCLQQRHTYLQPKHGASFSPQKHINDDLLDYARNRPITLLAYSALLSGGYAHPEKYDFSPYQGAHTNARLAMLRKVAAEKALSVNQVVLAWMLNNHPQILPLIAASTLEQLRENLAALDVILTEDEIRRLNTA
ncbi:MAG: aldo/keto reductase [Anaerolineaceae bacterium]|jgi:aryl-alcohol dehydrogenase-like predicted oxidoreductase